MVKTRPVVVITPRLRNRSGLCTVVPLSGTDPLPVENYHHKISFERPLPKPWGSPMYWAKADMFATVAFHRLHLIGLGKDQYGKRKYLNVSISAEELTNIQACVLHALNLSHLTNHL